MDTEQLILLALAIGLSLSDLEHITIGMLLDLAATRAAAYEKKEKPRTATQADYDNF